MSDRKPEDQNENASGLVEPRESLEDLLTTLSKQINSSDWLKQNTPQKFESENPEVAKVFKDLADERKKVNDLETK